MAKRLNPKRRREMRQHVAAMQLASDLNPTTQGSTGTVRQATVKTLYGPSTDRIKGLLHATLGVQQYAQHKRRKPSKPSVHVNAKDVVVTDPGNIRDQLPPEALPLPLPQKRMTRPNKVVTKGKKMWAAH